MDGQIAGHYKHTQIEHVVIFHAIMTKLSTACFSPLSVHPPTSFHGLRY